MLKLQRAGGISGNLLLWINDYLSNRRQYTRIGTSKSGKEEVKYGVPQGSVLGPLLFLLFCDDLPDCIQDKEDELEMYADNTTLTCLTVDQVVLKLNKTSQVNIWCQRNGMTMHPTKTEAMLVKRGTFVGPLPSVRQNDRIVQWVRKTKSQGITLDDKLKWKEHVEETKLAFASKLNLLKSINFLPKHMLEDFYWKVIFPAVTYDTLVWGSCGKTQFTTLEKMYARAARIIHRLDWNL